LLAAVYIGNHFDALLSTHAYRAIFLVVVVIPDERAFVV
jgi:hypothetical protein